MKKNAYLQTVKENESFSDSRKIFSYARDNLQFKYGYVTRQTFNDNYISTGWLGRKITALPETFWCGIIKVVYHLAKLILFGILQKYSGTDSYNLKVQCFKIVGDFQEAYRKLTSLFNDMYGQFYIQESQFQKTFYETYRSTCSLYTDKEDEDEIFKQTIEDLKETNRRWKNAFDNLNSFMLKNPHS